MAEEPRTSTGLAHEGFEEALQRLQAAEARVLELEAEVEELKRRLGESS